MEAVLGNGIRAIRFESAEAPLKSEALSSAETEVGLTFPPGLREYYLRSNGGVPDPYVFRRESIMVAVSECLPLRREGRGVSAMGTYRDLVLQRKIIANHFFPFAIDGGGNLFLVDCRTDEGAVYVWWHDVSDDNLLDLHTGISGFWSFLENE
jgi:hypothetical protein